MIAFRAWGSETTVLWVHDAIPLCWLARAMFHLAPVPVKDGAGPAGADDGVGKAGSVAACARVSTSLP